ncbi:DUF5133 domain-containing protein [Streptomyces sp. NBC_00647]|uniref:DUF5133 domain-containing protein n=1 Tax=Streptomyces sp. NBC_00647 TaxID=2975796 RepID=UPI003864E67C
MLMPLPAAVRRLVAEYESLLAEETPGGTPPSQRLRDLAYTLCVSTGTREIADALDTARSYLAETAVASAAHPAAMRSGPGRRAAAASPKSSAIAAPVFHHDSAGEPTARRDVSPRPGHRPVASPAASAGHGGGG